MPSLAEQLTEQFYQWEQRGRGWLLAPYPISLEPPFHPFWGHYVPAPYIDDGKRSTILSTVYDILYGKKDPVIAEQSYPDLEAFPFEDTGELHGIGIAFPKSHKQSFESLEQLLIMLSHRGGTMSFEIIADHASISIQLICPLENTPFVKSQLQAYFPHAILTDTTEALDSILIDNIPTYTVDFGLEEEFMRPIAMTSSFDHDPLRGVFGMFEHLKPGERAVLQILFSGTVNSWGESIINSVTDGKKTSFFANAPEMPGLAELKISEPLFAATIRLATQCPALDGARTLIDQLSSVIRTTSASGHNSLIPLWDSQYDFFDRICDITHRQSYRAGMLLNSRELATFVHVPSASVVSVKLHGNTRKTKAAPASTEGFAYTLGTNKHHGIEKTVSLSDEQRLRHIHLIGATGTGKSSLLLHLIAQDIQNNNGIAVLDPHGDLIEAVLTHIPEHRIHDVLIIDPFDTEYPIGFNILSAHSEIEKEILSSDLVALFRRFSTSWGDQMNSVFANAILAFLESSKGGTLVDLRKFLIEKEFREAFLKTVTDPDIVYYWQKEYPLLKSTSLGSILTRLDSFLRPKLIRNMVSQNKSVDFQALMDSKKIILVKLSHGLIGAENSFLLGAFIVAKIQQAAMARQAIAKEARNPFYLYIDEFHHFATPSMTTILSGARKYGLGLVLAHQDMVQVSKYDPELATALMANAGTRICFRLGDTDAKKVSEGFSFFESEDFQNLGIGEAICRVNQADNDFSIDTASSYANADTSVQRIIDCSRDQFATKSDTIPPAEPSAVPRQEDEQATPHMSAPDNGGLAEPPPQKPPPVLIVPVEEVIGAKQVQVHRYLQTYIKKMAVSYGYKATLEAPLPENTGRVDVLLEHNGKTIAVEISVTTNINWELHNIQKCLDAGYTKVYCCTDNISLQTSLRDLVPKTEQHRVCVCSLDELLAKLRPEEKVEEKPQERMKGYRVSVLYTDVSSEDASKKQSIIGSIVRNGRGRKG